MNEENQGLQRISERASQNGAANSLREAVDKEDRKTQKKVNAAQSKIYNALQIEDSTYQARLSTQFLEEKVCAQPIRALPSAITFSNYHRIWTKRKLEILGKNTSLRWIDWQRPAVLSRATKP